MVIEMRGPKTTKMSNLSSRIDIASISHFPIYMISHAMFHFVFHIYSECMTCRCKKNNQQIIPICMRNLKNGTQN